MTACQGSGQTTQVADLTPHARTVQATAVVQCPPPKASGMIDPQAFRNTSKGYRWTAGSPPQPDRPPAKDTPCRFDDAWVSGVTIDPPSPNRMAHWTPPEPSMESSIKVLDGSTLPPPPNSQIIPENVARIAGEYRFTVHFTYAGVYNGVDWECRGSYEWGPASTCWDDGRYGPVIRCMNVDPIGKVAPALANPPSPLSVPAIRDRLGQLQHQSNAGRIGVSPTDPTRQFVTLPSCWWINGAEPVTTFEVTVDAPPNADGRGLTYVYRVTVGLQSVHWDYGDGATWDGDAGHPYDASGTCTNPHTYTKVSAIGNPGAVPCPAAYPHPSVDDGCYRVQANETYSVSAVAYWNDNGGDYRGHPLDPQAPFTIPATETYVRALQIEGIPIAN
ncbi:MAG: hypothetical protein ABR598_03040 [Candidatus Dormibacteria bacterium]